MDALTGLRFAARLRSSGPELRNAFVVPRPDGPVVWVHAPADMSVGPLLDLKNRMAGLDHPVTMVRTSNETARDTNLTTPGSVFTEPVPETLRDIRRFFEHWAPDVGLWTGALAPPLLLDTAAAAGVPLYLVNPKDPSGATAREARIEKLLLRKFRHVIATDEDQASRLRSVALPEDRVDALGPFTDVQRPLKCNESDRQEFADAIGTRPVWLAMAPAARELPLVLKAHAQAIRSSHRLLLVLATDKDAKGPHLVHALSEAGWQVASRGEDELPGETTEIYIADSVEEIGLWYRISPLCFLGGSLTDGPRRNPMEAAALGAAIMAGPHGGKRAQALDRLDRAAAMRRVYDAGSLGRAVSDLIAPDRLAMLAHRAWDVATDGAEVGDRLAELLSAALSEPTR